MQYLFKGEREGGYYNFGELMSEIKRRVIYVYL